MGKEKIDVLIEGGKATAAPPLGPALGPMGVNIGQVVADINKKTESFRGMQVPVKVIIDTDSKEYEIEIGTPPASSLIIKEAGIQKGASNPLTDKVADLKMEQIIKIAKMKESSLLGKTMKERVKEIMGTCQSMGILVEGKPAHDTIEEVNKGGFEETIRLEKTELTAEELKELEEEKKKLAEEFEKRREEFMNLAKQTVSEMKGKESSAIKHKLQELKIPEQIIKEVVPDEEAKPAEGDTPAGEAKDAPPAEKK